MKYSILYIKTNEQITILNGILYKNIIKYYNIFLFPKVLYECTKLDNFFVKNINI